ncbi:MAG TPA: MlaD family protein [Gemmatimonadaceae bacterium]|nr:MlaD family protein [Gemmatimonadaceae bacterium]
MPPRVRWRNLLPGIIAAAIVLVLAFGVLLFAGIGRVRGAKLRLYVLTGEARGVMRGTEVWLAGQKIGVVDGVEFLPPSGDSAARLAIATTIRRSEAEQIRRDSRVQIRAGANIISPVVVYLFAGTPQSARANDGDTLRAQAQSDVEVAAVKMKGALQDVDPMMNDVRTIMRDVHDPGGTIGAALSGGLTRRSDVSELQSRFTALRQRLFGASGTARSRAELFARAHVALARADSIRSLLAAPGTSFGRFRRDSTLAQSIAQVRNDLATVRAQLASDAGTVGRLKSDSALVNAVAAAREEMAALFADVRRRPLHYVAF